MKRFSEYTLLVDERIKTICPDADRLPGLYEPIRYAMTAGGKRLRPVLTLMCCDAFGGDVEAAIDPAVGMEIFHNFTLLHDDVMDHSDMRRGRPSVHKKWDENTAILSGDTMLTMATQLVSKVSDDKLRRVLDTFNDTAIKVYEGQQMDMDFEQRTDVPLDEYLEMVRLKTSALLGGAAVIGAILGGASDEDCHAMYKYAESLGMAFQIQDDYLDVYGNEKTFGKPIGGDINNNKKTWLMISALNMQNSSVEALRSAIQLPAGPLKVKTVTKLYDVLGIPDAAKKAVAYYSSEAIKALNSTSLDKNAKQALHSVVERLLGRNK